MERMFSPQVRRDLGLHEARRWHLGDVGCQSFRKGTGVVGRTVLARCLSYHLLLLILCLVSGSLMWKPGRIYVNHVDLRSESRGGTVPRACERLRAEESPRESWALAVECSGVGASAPEQHPRCGHLRRVAEKLCGMVFRWAMVILKLTGKGAVDYLTAGLWNNNAKKSEHTPSKSKQS